MVGSRVVQERNDRARQVPQQVAQELADLFLPYIVKPELVVEAQVVAFRADGDP